MISSKETKNKSRKPAATCFKDLGVLVISIAQLILQHHTPTGHRMLTNDEKDLWSNGDKEISRTFNDRIYRTEAVAPRSYADPTVTHIMALL